MTTETMVRDDYSYDHVRSKTLMDDMGFRSEAPRPGDRLPDLTCRRPTAAGSHLPICWRRAPCCSSRAPSPVQ